jgi:hypothetical protein
MIWYDVLGAALSLRQFPGIVFQHVDYISIESER